MSRSSAAQRRALEIMRRPEGGAGETRPVVVSPADPTTERREVVATLRQIIDTLAELADAAPITQASSPAKELSLLLNAVEAGRLLSISRAKVLDLAARGEIPSLRIRGSVRIPRDSLQTWIVERTNSARPTSNGLAEWAHRWSNES
jgi:excisionase family DNA binding protein